MDTYEVSRPGDGDPLLLAAGELGGEVVQPLPQPHGAQHLGGVHGILADLGGQLHVLQGRQVGHQVVKLKNKANIVAAVGGQTLGVIGGDLLHAQKDPALGEGVHAAENVEKGGLGERLNNFPAQLSGGEQQRVAIARALAKNPQLLLCDEPTGALDYHTGKSILKLLQLMSRKNGMTVVIITHNSALTAMADRVIQVKNGAVTSEEINDRPVPVEEIEW